MQFVQSLLLFFLTSYFTIADSVISGPCTTNEYLQDYICKPCDVECDGCYFSTNTDCIKCVNFSQDGKTCISKCPSGYFKSEYGIECQPCDIKFCKTCVSLSKCAECQDGFELSLAQDSCQVENANIDQFIQISENNTSNPPDYEIVQQCDSQSLPNSYGYCERIKQCSYSYASSNTHQICFENISESIQLAQSDNYIIAFKSTQALVYSKKDLQLIWPIHLVQSDEIVKIICLDDIAYLIFHKTLQIINLELGITQQIIPMPSNDINNSDISRIFLHGISKNYFFFTTSQLKQKFFLISLKKSNPQDYSMIYASAEVSQGLFDDITNILIIVSVRKLMFLSINEDGISYTTLAPQNYGFSDDYKITSEIFKNTQATESYVIITVSAGFAVVSMNSQSVVLKALYGVFPIEYRFLMNLRLCVVISAVQVQMFEIDRIIYDDVDVLNDQYYQFFPTTGTLFLAESNSLIFALGVVFQYAIFVFSSDMVLSNTIQLDHKDISALSAWETDDGTQSFVIASNNYLELFENFSSKGKGQEGCIDEYKSIFPDFYVLQTDIVRDGIRKLDIQVAYNLDNTLSVVILRGEGQIVQKKINISHEFLNNNINNYLDIFMRVNIDVINSILFVVVRNLSSSSLIQLLFSYKSFSIIEAKFYTSVFYFSISPLIFTANENYSQISSIYSNYQGNSLEVIKQISSGSTASSSSNSRNCASIPSHFIAWVEDTVSQLDGSVSQTIQVLDYITLAEFVIPGISNLKYIQFLEDKYIFFVTSTLICLQPISIPSGPLITNTHEYIDDDSSNYNTFKATFSEDIEILVIYAEKMQYDFYLTTQYSTYELHTLTKLGQLSPMIFSMYVDWMDLVMQNNYQLYFEINPLEGTKLVISAIYNQVDDLFGISENRISFVSDKTNPIYEKTYFYFRFDQSITSYLDQPTYLLFDGPILSKTKNQLNYIDYNLPSALVTLSQLGKAHIKSNKLFIGNNFIKISQQLDYSWNGKLSQIQSSGRSLIMLDIENLNGSSMMAMFSFLDGQTVAQYDYVNKCNEITSKYLNSSDSIALCDNNIISIFSSNQLKTNPTINLSQAIYSQTLTSDTSQSSILFSNLQPIMFISSLGVVNYINNTTKSIDNFAFSTQSKQYKETTSQFVLYNPINSSFYIINTSTLDFSAIPFDSSSNTILKLQIFQSTIVIAYLKELTNNIILNIFDYQMNLMFELSEIVDNIKFTSEIFVACSDESAIVLLLEFSQIGYALPFVQNSMPLFTNTIGKHFLGCFTEYLIFWVDTSPNYVITIVAQNDLTIDVNTFQIDYKIHFKFTSLFADNAYDIPITYYASKGLLRISDIFISLTSSLQYYSYTNDYILDHESNHLIEIRSEFKDQVITLNCLDLQILAPFREINLRASSMLLNKQSQKIQPDQTFQMSALLLEFNQLWYFNANTASIVNYNISSNAVNKQFQLQNTLDSTSMDSWKICQITFLGDANNPSLIDQYFILLLRNYLILFTDNTIIKEIPYSIESILISNSECTQIFLHDSSTVSKIDITQIINSNELDIHQTVLFTISDNTNNILRVQLFKYYLTIQLNTGVLRIINLDLTSQTNNIDLQVLTSDQLNYSEIDYTMYSLTNTQQFLILASNNTLQMYQLSDNPIVLVTFPSFITNINSFIVKSIDSSNNRILIATDDYYIYAFKIIFTGNENLIPSIYSQTKLSIPFKSSLVDLNSKWVAVISSSIIEIFDIRGFSLSQVYLIENSDFSNVSDIRLVDEQFIVVVDLMNIYVYRLFKMTDSYNLINQLPLSQSTLQGLQITNINMKSVLEIISLNYQDIQHLYFELEDYSNNHWNIPTFNSNTCIFETQINPVPDLQIIQFDNINKLNANKIKKIALTISNSGQILSIPTIFDIRPANIIDLEYDLQGFTISISTVTSTDGVLYISNQDISTMSFKNGTIDLGSTAILFEGFDTVQFSNVTLLGQLKFKDVGKIQFSEVIFKNTLSPTDQTGMTQVLVEVNNTNLSGKLIMNNISISQNPILFLLLSAFNVKSISFANVILSSDTPSVNQGFDGSFINITSSEQLNLSQLTMFQVNIPSNFLTATSVKNITITDVHVSKVNGINSQRMLLDGNGVSTQFPLFQLIQSEISVTISRFNISSCTFKQILSVSQLLESTSSDQQKIIQTTVTSINSIVKISDVFLDHINPLDQSKSSLIYIYGGYLSLVNIEISQIMGGFSKALEISSTSSTSTQNLSFSSLNNLDNLLFLTSSSSTTLTLTLIENCYQINNYLSVSLSPFEINHLQINTTSWQHDPSNLSPHVLFSALNIRSNDNLNSKLSANQPPTYKISNSYIVGVINSQGDGAAMYCSKTVGLQITQSQFINNKSQFNGGAIFAENSLIILQNVEVINNSAALSGGGFYIIETLIYVSDLPSPISKSKISQNTALIGGGMRYFSSLIELQPSIVRLHPIDLFSNNKAKYYGEDFSMYPTSIQIRNEINNDIIQTTFTAVSSQSSQKEKVINIILSFCSLQFSFLSLQILLSWIDEAGKNLKLSFTFNEDWKVSGNKYYSIYQEMQSYTTFVISSPEIKFAAEFSKIQLQGSSFSSLPSDEIITLEVAMLFKPSRTATFSIQSSITPINSSYLWQTQTKLESLTQNFRPCKSGEIFNYVGSNGYYECKTCKDNTYSLVIPTSFDALCLSCPKKAKACEGDTIQLFSGYWNEKGTSTILYCDEAPSNCQQDINKHQQCSEGYYGPKCQSCDYYSIDWKSAKYGRTGQYSCTNCDVSSEQINQMILLVIMLLLFGAYQGYLSIEISNYTQNVVKGMYLKRAGIINFGFSLHSNQLSIISKILINYFQLLQVISRFHFNLPSGMEFFVNFFGNPISTTKFSFDCIIIQNILSNDHNYLEDSSQIQVVYIRLFVNFLNILLYFLIAIIIITIYCIVSLKNKKFPVILSFLKRYLRTSFYYLYYLLYPSIVLTLIEVISCIQIGSKSYVSSDTQFECGNQQHQIFGYYLSLPLLILFTIIIPLRIFAFQLRNHKTKLQTSFIYLSYSFFYSEYKEQYYYWEALKIIMKSLVFLFIHFFNQQEVIAGSAISLVIAIYTRLTYTSQPYKRHIFNQIDFAGGIAIFASFQFAQLNFSSSDSGFQALYFSLLILVNIVYFISFLRQATIHKISYNEKSWYFQFIVCLKKYFPQVANNFTIQIQSCIRSHKGWKKVKDTLFSYRSKKQLSNRFNSKPSEEALKQPLQESIQKTLEKKTSIFATNSQQRILLSEIDIKPITIETQTKEEKDKFIPPITSIIQAMKTQETPMLTSQDYSMTPTYQLISNTNSHFNDYLASSKLLAEDPNNDQPTNINQIETPICYKQFPK